MHTCCHFRHRRWYFITTGIRTGIREGEDHARRSQGTRCAVVWRDQGLPGFSTPDDKGNWTGLDVDICRAIAAVVLNDPSKIKFVPLSAKDRFIALQWGDIDVLSRDTSWTLSRDTSLGGNFTGVTYYDGQGFLVRKSLKVNSALELNSASVCVRPAPRANKISPITSKAIR